MKSPKVVLLVVALFFANMSFACDFCNGYLGINPHYKKNKIGLRGNYNYSELKNVFVNEAEIKKYTENRSTAEVFAELYPVQKLQLLVYVPYVQNFSKITQGQQLHQRIASPQSSQHFTEPSEADKSNKILYSGFGDPTLLAHYQLFNISAHDSSKISHRLLAGGGVRFPLGNSSVKNNDISEQMHAPGTGSFSELVSVVYIARRNKSSFACNANAMVSQYNKNEFKPGTRFNAGANFYYSVGKKEKYIPSVGCSFETAQKNKIDNKEIFDSGGNVLFLQNSHDFYINHLGFSLTAFIPIAQKVDGLQAKNKIRAMASLSYAW